MKDYAIVDGKLTWVRPSVTELYLSGNQLTDEQAAETMELVKRNREGRA